MYNEIQHLKFIVLHKVCESDVYFVFVWFRFVLMFMVALIAHNIYLFCVLYTYTYTYS